MPAVDPLHPAQVAARIARWAHDGPQGPLTLELYPTVRCNLSCLFCDTTDRHRPPVDELSRERLLAIVDEAADLGVARVFVLGGGEPLARRDTTPAVLRRIKERGLEGGLTTNGTLLDARLSRQLADTGWDEVQFSIDGPTAAIHDRLRGRPGAFRKTVSAACRLAVDRRRRGARLPRIGLHFVLTNENLHTLADMVRLAHALGAFRVDFDALIAYRPEQQALQLSAAQRQALPAQAAAALEEAHRLGIATTLQHFCDPERLDRGNTRPADGEGSGLRNAPCLKAWHYLVVQADGRTSPCCVLAGQGGSVAETGLAAAWQADPFLRSVRAAMEAGRPLPRCRECSWNILGHERLIRDHLRQVTS